MKTLSPPLARMIMVMACFIGIFASAYLLYTYVTGAPISCAIVSGCDQVRASKWAYTFGIPRPLLGVVFYLGVFALLVVRAATTWRAKELLWLTRVAATIAFIESGFLFAIQWIDLKAFCLWCLISALASVVLFAMMPFDREQTEEGVRSARELRGYLLSLVVFAVLASGGFVALLYT